MASDLFWMSFCKVLSLAWGVCWSSLLQSLFRASTLTREEQVRRRCPCWEPTCSELQEGYHRRAPAKFLHGRDSFPPALCTGNRTPPGTAVLMREERLHKLHFLPHLDSDELCLPSRPVVSITLAQLWLGLRVRILQIKKQI